MNGKFISLASIIERVYRGTEYENIPWQDAAEDVIDVLRLIGVPNVYYDRVTNGQNDNPIPIVIDGYKGELPTDMAIVGPCRLVHLNGNDEIVGFTAMHESQDLFYQSPTVLEDQNTNQYNLAGSIAPTSIEQRLDLAQENIDDGNLTDAEDQIQDIVDDVRRAGLRATSSNFIGTNFVPKYKITNNYMYTNFEYGFVEMSYKAYPVDELGMPMILDDIRYIKAVEWYLISRIDFKRWRTSRNAADANFYAHSDKEACWYIASARSKSKVPSLDMMESIKGMILRSIVKLNEHKNNFKNTDIIEQRKF
jgi:hypothetical protein